MEELFVTHTAGIHHLAVLSILTRKDKNISSIISKCEEVFLLFSLEMCLVLHFCRKRVRESFIAFFFFNVSLLKIIYYPIIDSNKNKLEKMILENS